MENFVGRVNILRFGFEFFDAVDYEAVMIVVNSGYLDLNVVLVDLMIVVH